MIISDFLSNSARKYPDKAAVKHGGNQYTYCQLLDLSNAFATYLLGKGIEKGDRIAVFMDNCVEYAISYFGILKCGAIAVPLNNQLVSGEIVPLLKDCGPKAVVTVNKNCEKIEEAVKESGISAKVVNISNLDLPKGCDEQNIFPDVSEEDLSMIIYTSGTTGRQKGVVLSHSNLDSNADSIIEYLGLTSDDSIMAVMPFYYSYGNSLLTTHIKAGGTIVINNSFMYPNVVLDEILSENVTGFAGVPSHFSILLNKSALRKYKFPELRYVTQAGGAMDPEMIKEFVGIMPDVRFFVMYGQTEASARLSYLDPDMLTEKMGSVGKNIPGVELEILDENGKKADPGDIGEIVARGKNIMKGYWNDDAETSLVLKKEGLYTGDLALIDNDGYIYIKGRSKDMIKSGANRISPLEIETIISKFPGISGCAAVGIPDKILGETIKLFIVVDDEKITTEDILIYCRENMASYKVPGCIEIIDELPKTHTGKIRRRDLKAAGKEA
ncbi:class I adenylate-forming enzyme family protein [Elusimicrobiota bacterium]